MTRMLGSMAVLAIVGCGSPTGGADGSGAPDGGASDATRGDGGNTAADLAGGTDMAQADMAAPPSEWLRTQGNHILAPNGKPWHGRGANVHDTRSCNACTTLAPSVAMVNRMVDELTDGWKANLIRLDLESYADSGGYRTQYKSVLDDAAYLGDVVQIVDHIATKPNTYVLLSVWVDPSLSPVEWPTVATQMEWAKLTDAFKSQPRVMFGLVNEPHDIPQNNDQLAAAMNATVQVIRNVEMMNNTPHHIVVVQGTNGYARNLDYWAAHPMTIDGGLDIAYETHPYNPTADFAALFLDPAKTIPVIVGEFGPFSGVVDADLMNLMAMCEAAEIPYIAWNFHMRCSPDLLVDNTTDGCNLQSFVPTAFGTLLKNQLATPW